MTGSSAWAALLLAAAVVLLPDRPRRPVSAVRPEAVLSPLSPPRSPVLPSPRSTPTGPRRRGLVAGSAVAAAGTALAPGLWWLVAPLAGAIGWWVARGALRPSAATSDADTAWLATHGEVLAACLEAGLAMSAGLSAASTVASQGAGDDGSAPHGRPGIPGPRVALDAVAAMLALGADAEAAWRPAAEDPRLAALAAAGRRSMDGGAALAQAVHEHLAAGRQEAQAADRRAAGRGGVLITAPLGLCFLPAFLCLGLAPVVLGLFADLHLF